jgi:hypothetical protein
MVAYVIKIRGEMQKKIFWSYDDAADFMFGVDGGYEIVKVEIKEISSDI